MIQQMLSFIIIIIIMCESLRICYLELEFYAGLKFNIFEKW